MLGGSYLGGTYLGGSGVIGTVKRLVHSGLRLTARIGASFGITARIRGALTIDGDG